MGHRGVEPESNPSFWMKLDVNSRRYVQMRKSSELNSGDLRISTYLLQFRYDFVCALGIFSGSAPLRPQIFTPFIAGFRAHNNYNVQYRNTWHSHLIQKRVWSYLPTLSYHISLISARIHLILGEFVFPNRTWGIFNLNDAKQRLFFVAAKVIVVRPVVTCCGRLACYVA